MSTYASILVLSIVTTFYKPCLCDQSPTGTPLRGLGTPGSGASALLMHIAALLTLPGC